ncbi:WD repeat domain-containing protein [Colletotrichum nymphaeae SA-01]|uniref:WD repeat domain-containing protein n=1 Tax=Colletotrichum nymphaeae SA-01 TaxID=1460502 RepID=A0A135UNX7_9PEZI|nr:WD repeat domain-containing protein [Colletotrichum nymphaeae SA-01]
MQSRLFARSTGELSPDGFAQATTSGLIRSFAAAPQHRFDGEGAEPEEEGRHVNLWAHRIGVNALALDKFDGRLLLSGGADGSVKLWDLHQESNPHKSHIFQPIANIARSIGDETNTHKHGITHLDFYPFDNEAFLSSSFDRSLKLWSTQRMTVSANFDLNANIYTHATSPVANHLLVACATQHSSVRLVDLRSGTSIRSLVAHGGAVLSAAWNPRQEHALATGHVDGKVRVWDIRRASGLVGQLDQEDSLGIVHRFDHAMASGLDWKRMPHFRNSARAHNEGVNGLTWTDDGKYIVSAGLDCRIRVWDAATGANTLASFGSLIQNQQPKTVNMFVTPARLTPSRRDLLFYPNEQEILVMDLHEGTLVTRLRVPGPHAAAVYQNNGLNVKNRTMSMVWRGSGGSGLQKGPIMGGGSSFGAVYSAHLDGQIRSWMPRLPGPEDDDDTPDPQDANEEERSRKRKALDDAFRSLMGKQITFS